MSLTDTERQMLAFEAQWWKHRGAKEQAIRDLFDLSATRYAQVLGQLIDRPEALADHPQVVKRLRRVREQGAQRRAGYRLGSRG